MAIHILFFGLFIGLGTTAGAQELTQFEAIEFEPSVVDQFPLASGQLSAEDYLENLNVERFREGVSPGNPTVQTLDTNQLGELARAPGTDRARDQVDYDYVYNQLQDSDQLGAALAAQAAGSDEWVTIVTIMSANLPNLEASGQTADLAKALGMMSQIQLGGLGETSLTNVQLDLANDQTIWRIDGIDYTLPIQNAPVREVMKWTPADEIPALFAAYELETPQDWAVIFDQFDSTEKQYADVEWKDLRDRAIENGTYAQLDRLIESDPSLRRLLAIDFTPEARINYLESGELNPLGQVQRGGLYLEQGDATLAAESYNSALALDSENLSAKVGLAQIALSPSANQIDGLPNRQDALNTLQAGQAAGYFDASFTLAMSEDLVPPDQRVLASVAAQHQAVSPEDSAAARNAQSSNCRAAAEAGDGTIKCQFFDIAYITNRAPVSDGGVLVDFGKKLVGDTEMSIGILRNDLVIAQTIPDGPPGLISWAGCAGLGVCLPTEILRPEASDTGFEGISIQHDGSLADRIAASSDHFSTGYRNPDRALVFIHGFNTDFREAVDALTNLMITARYPSTPFLLSWPSEGRLWDKNFGERKLHRSLALNYPHDRNMVTDSCATMHAALSAVIDQYGAGNVDLVIHSMGNQLFYEMLNGCGAAQLSWPTSGGAPFRYLILSAPDVAVNNFQSALNAYTGHAEKTFIYGTNNDLVLKVSGYLNRTYGDRTSGYVNRLGYFGDPASISNQINWINTITVDGLSRYAPLNHSHYINTAPVRRDIAMILNGHDHEGAERCVFPANDTGVFFYISPNCL